MIRIFLVDDQKNVRQGLKMQLELEPDLAVVGEASNGCDAVNEVPRVKPDVVVMDLEMPGMNGIDATEQIHISDPSVPVIFLSVYDDSRIQLQAARAGGVAFISKRGGTELLLKAIRSVAKI